MEIVNLLLSKNLMPIVNHDNRWFGYIEQHAEAAALGLLPGRAVHFYVVRSNRKNAYTFKADGQYIVTITDAVFKGVGETVAKMLNTEAIRRFMQSSLDLSYDFDLSAPDQLTVGSSTSAPISHEQYLWWSIFEETFEGALLYILFHELAHIAHGDADGLSTVSSDDAYQIVMRLIDLDEIGGEGPNRHARFSEYEADKEAACWLFQRVVRRAAQDTVYTASHFGLAAFGMFISMIHLSRHQPDTQEILQSFDHPSFDLRVQGAWKGMALVLQAELDAASESVVHVIISRLREAIETVMAGVPIRNLGIDIFPLVEE